MVNLELMKLCSISNCKNPVFGTDKNTKKGFCKPHQGFRTDIKKFIRKKTHKERVLSLKRNKYNFDPTQWSFSSELEMFKKLWEVSDKKSALSERNLKNLENSDVWINCFAHILNKNHFPLFRFNPENIMIIHPYEHYLIDHGRIKDRINYIEEFSKTDFNIFYKQQTLLKEKYKLITSKE